MTDTATEVEAEAPAPAPLEYFLTYDATNGEFTGWCETSLHVSIPQPSVPVSNEEYLVYRRELSVGRVIHVEGGEIVVGDHVPDLEATKKSRIDQLNRAYVQQQVPFVSFTNKVGFTAEYGARQTDKDQLKEAIDAGKAAWTVNLWLDGRGAPVSPMTFADLQGLAKALDTVTPPTHSRLLECINAVLSATTVDDVNTVAL